MRKVLFLFLAINLFLVLASTVSAHHKEAVLGEATAPSELIFPPITSGTGFILPDSPLFFVDQIFQQVKLTLAFSPESRAKVRAAIAGERLAELRLMLARDNQGGINTALDQLTRESALAAEDLADASAQGKDVKLLAKEINDSIKLQRKLLNEVASQTRGTLKLQLKAARQALKEAKVEVEDELHEDELENEIDEDLEDELADEVEDALESAQDIRIDIVSLQKEASKSAAKALNRREEAVKKAIEERNEALRKSEQKLLEAEKKKQKALLEAQGEAAEEAQEALKKAQEATSKFRKAQQKVFEIKSRSIEETTESSNSGSGSSGSNSGSSNDDEN